MIQPLGNRVLVRRIVKRDEGVIDTSAHDERSGADMILVEGEILAVGPGHYDDDMGAFVPTTVKAGQHVIFNARWNDFTSGELVGSDCDQKGPLERPMPQWQYATDQKDLHLITEGDIAGILA